MSGPATLSGRLPDGDANGLGAIVRELVDDPGAIQVAVLPLDLEADVESAFGPDDPPPSPPTRKGRPR